MSFPRKRESRTKGAISVALILWFILIGVITVSYINCCRKLHLYVLARLATAEFLLPDDKNTEDISRFKNSYVIPSLPDNQENPAVHLFQSIKYHKMTPLLYTCMGTLYAQTEKINYYVKKN
jgi:hypothetical protein